MFKIVVMCTVTSCTSVVTSVLGKSYCRLEGRKCKWRQNILPIRLAVAYEI